MKLTIHNALEYTLDDSLQENRQHPSDNSAFPFHLT